MCYNTDNDMDKITENIYLGNYVASHNADYLRQLGITKVLSMMDYGAPNYINGPYFKQKIIKIVDSPTQNIIQYFGECLNFIRGNDKILVHCMVGSSRSATIVIAYLMWSQRITYEQALQFVNQKRFCVNPNAGFKNQLKLFEKLLKENDYDLNRIEFNNIRLDKKITDYKSANYSPYINNNYL